MSHFQKPVTILTGFLGAGKTTFLNHLLKQNEGKRYAIIENEFGEQGIDGDLVVRPDETIVEMNNGCLCCTLNDNLYDILNDLFDRRDDFDEIIIEATGVADPTGLAEPFVAHPLVKKHFPVKGVICLVDAELIETHLAETEEAKNQVAYSDVLLINKTDLVSEGYLQELEGKLRQINPLATVQRGNRDAFPVIQLNPDGQSPLDEIFHHTHSHSPSEQETSFPISKPHAHHHHKHTEEIVSLTFFLDQPFDKAMLDRNLYLYLLIQSKGLYRMKGLAWVEGSDEQYVVQSVGKRLDIEPRGEWPQGEPRKTVMVFIGKDLKREGLEKLLARCISKSSAIH
ncbi:GTP-binding protein [Pontibacter sp. G13]|uniref:CobW family GTP-binding protein n=1 Tax=Pontibacter sp. G13 TaxID=3074898 RepID=UPI00288BDA95|nr:GTP-binding protein [Pontibacter sp. G13]WNJ19166.1 GTP-binding protein [Pontibacter sp. G13]